MKKTRIILSVLLAIYANTVFAQAENHNSQVARNLEIFDEIYKALDLYYVDTLAADTAIKWAIDGMLMKVDPFTAYYPSDDEELKQMATGKYGGIGSIIRFSKKHDRVVIDEPYQNTPSDRAGLKAGDILISIDGKDVKGMLPAKVTTMLRGESGTTFSLRFQRPGEKKPRTVRITRATIQTPSVPYYGMSDNRTGYILLTGFTDGAAREVRYALEQIRNQGGNKLILDLRNNPGGSITEAVDIVNLFVAKGQKVVYTKGKQSIANREYLTTTDPVDSVMPVIVIVNQNSASASEIVSGSLQDMDRAVIIGSRTYGKGLVQAIRDVPYRGQMKLTTARYYIPSGRCIQAHQYNHDGTIRTTPDSLTKVFHTRIGREVRDGGGIKPDIISEPDSLPTMIYDLIQSDPYFDWITRYAQKHSGISEAGSFILSDADYLDFCQYIKDEKFTYNRRSDSAIKFLKEIARQEGYLEIAKTEMDSLEKRFAPDLDYDLRRHKSKIIPFIESEIVTRYYYQGGYVRQQLKSDKVYHEALQLISDRERFDDILKTRPASDTK
ncbi:MAG: S41 family peptidase [Bacteroidaceae bacterium]|nr:S41 family peptidase [Bacteroidaceae bacterium]